MEFRAGQKIRLFIHPGAEVTTTTFCCNRQGDPVFAFVRGRAEPLVIDGIRTDSPDVYRVANASGDAWVPEAWIVPEEPILP